MSNVFDPNIYSMSEVINDMAQKFIPEEDESTLALGSYGFWNAMFAKELSDNIRIAQENANEMFYNKARQPKNVLAFAISSDIEDINAKPSKLPIQLWIMESDLESLIEEHDPVNKKSMIFDTMLPLYIGDYEYHLDYNLQVTRREIVTGNVYAGKYLMTVDNTISDIETPYIDTPYRMKRNGKTYICFSVDVHQVYKTRNTKKLISSNIIENKSYQFSYEHQLADFDVSISEKDTIVNLKPVFSGASTQGIDLYCNYTFIDDENIRVMFDQDSYMPEINAQVITTIQTTAGAEANRTYTNSSTITLKDTDDYTYLSTQIVIFPQGKSEDGKDAKTTEELQKLLPQQALSRGNLTTNTDLNNYFNKYNTSTSKLAFQKKEHNQRERRYFGYFLHKDSDNNVVPTNTIDLTLKVKDLFNDQNKWITKYFEYTGNTISNAVFTFEAGAYIGLMKLISTDINGKYISEISEDGTQLNYVISDKAEFIINPDELLENRPDLVKNYMTIHYPNLNPEEMSDERAALESMTIAEFYNKLGFLYTLPYKTSITSKGPYSSFYMTLMDEIYRVNYYQGNDNAPIEMVLTYANWTREYGGEGKYTLECQITQSIDDDMGLLTEIESAQMTMPAYNLVETKNTEDGPVTTNTTCRSIDELVLKALTSTADSVLATDANNPSLGNILPAEGETKFYVIANKLNDTSTVVFNTEVEANDQFSAYKLDTEYVYIKIIDSNGIVYNTYDAVNGEEEEEDFTSNKKYIVTHTNLVNGTTVEEEYDALIDALNKSITTYYAASPVVNYKVYEETEGTTTRNLLYDSSVSFSDSSLHYLQIKNNEGIINRTVTMAEADAVIAKLPTKQGYEYQVFDKYGYIQEGYNTYTQKWEDYETKQSSTITVIDDFSDYDADKDRLTDTSDLLDNLILQKLKVVTFNMVTKEPTFCKYVNSLSAAIRYMAKSANTCSIYYVNDQDISTTEFTTEEDDLIYEYDYDLNPIPILRIAIVDKKDENNRCLIYSKDYESEELTPDDMETFAQELELDYDIKEYSYNMYQYSSGTDNIIANNNVNPTTYYDRGDIDQSSRTYIVEYNKDGFNKKSSSFYTMQQVLEKYKDGTFFKNKLIKNEASANGVILYDGLGHIERYYLEWFDDNQQSNCYIIKSRSKLATVYARVKNTISKLIENGTLSSSEDVSYYIKVYDQFGNTIDIENDFYEYLDQKYYPAWALYKVYGINISTETDDETGEETESRDTTIMYYSNIEDALEGSLSSYDSVVIVDDEERELFNIEDAQSCSLTKILAVGKSEAGSRVYTFDDDTEYNDSFIGSNPDIEIIQTYNVTINGTEYDVTGRSFKDESSNKESIFVDVDSITDTANIGITDTSDGDDDSDVDTESLFRRNAIPVALFAGLDGLNVEPVALDDDTETKGSRDTDSGVTTTTSSGITIINGKKVICKTTGLLVIYDEENKPLCYYKADLSGYDIDNGTYTYMLKFNPITNDMLNDSNCILLEKGNVNDSTGCHFYGGANNGAVGQTYVPANCPAKIYLLSKFTDEDGNVTTSSDGAILDLQYIITPSGIANLGLTDYIVTNIYEIKGGIDFFEDFSEIVNSTVKANTVAPDNADPYNTYTIYSLPVIRKDYTRSKKMITEYLKELKSEKDQIEESLSILEDQYQIDFKFYNTYGPAHIYYTADSNGENKEILDRVNISLTFAIKLRKTTDDYTANYIIKDIKDAIENLDKVDDYHLENLAADLYQTYKNSIYYIEFRGFNNYGPDRRHFFLDNNTTLANIPPEFININIQIDGEDDNLKYTPDINVPTI